MNELIASTASIHSSPESPRSRRIHMVLIDFNGIPLQTIDSKLSLSRYNICRRRIIYPE